MDVARGTMLLVLAVTLGACGSDGRELRSPTAPLPAPTTVDQSLDSSLATVDAIVPPVSAGVPSPPPVADPRVVVDRLYSPADARAEMVGSGARPGDPVTVDGQPADVVSFDVASDGSFVLRVRIDAAGGHTVCVVEACSFVDVVVAEPSTPAASSP